MRKTARPVVWEGDGAQSPSLDPILWEHWTCIGGAGLDQGQLSGQSAKPAETGLFSIKAMVRVFHFLQTRWSARGWESSAGQNLP